MLKKNKPGHAEIQSSELQHGSYWIYCHSSNVGCLADLTAPVALQMKLICPVQVTEALKLGSGDQKVEAAGSASSSPIKNLILIPGIN